MSKTSVEKRFKLRAVGTKQFFSTMTPYKGPTFTKKGSQWGTQEMAILRWNDYNLRRLIENKQWPDLELVTYELVAVEKNAERDSTDMSSIIPFVLACPYETRLHGLLKRLVAEGRSWSSVVFVDETEDEPIPTDAIAMLEDYAHVSYSYGDSWNTGRYVTAQHIYVLPKESDSLVLKMTMGANIVRILDREANTLYERII